MRGNFFWGDIAEVVLYDRQLDSAERATLETDIHTRYKIPRMPDPLPPVITWDAVPSPLHFIPEGGDLHVKGTVADAAVRRVVLTLDSSGIDTDEWVFNTDKTTTIDISRPVVAGLHQYHLQVDAELADGSVRRLVDATIGRLTAKFSLNHFVIGSR